MKENKTPEGLARRASKGDEGYYRSRTAMMSDSSEMLDGYIKNIADTILFYLGGD